MSSLITRLENIRLDHLKRASVCKDRGLTARVGFHHDAASTIAETIRELRSASRERRG